MQMQPVKTTWQKQLLRDVIQSRLNGRKWRCGRSGLPNGSFNVTFSARNTPVHRWHWPLNFCLSAILFFFFYRLMYATENPRAVLESCSPVQRICNHDLYRFVSRNHGPDWYRVFPGRFTMLLISPEIDLCGNLWRDMDARIPRKNLERNPLFRWIRRIQDFTTSLYWEFLFI